MIIKSEIVGKTVLEYAPDSEMADVFKRVADAIYNNREAKVPHALSKDELKEIAKEITKSYESKLH